MGGSVDPTSGMVIWDAHVPLDEQPRYYAAHPPHALDGLNCTAIDLPGFRFDGHGEPINMVFELACSCGGILFTVLAHVQNGELIPPIELECSGCDSTYVVFDPRRQGYDGALGFGEQYEVDDRVEALSVDDVDAPHRVIARFEFPSDVLGAQETDADNCVAEDLFSWITILGRDPHGVPVIVFDYECA